MLSLKKYVFYVILNKLLNKSYINYLICGDPEKKKINLTFKYKFE